MSYPKARAVYRVLLRSFPNRFRQRWGEEMEGSFVHVLERDARRLGYVRWIRVWPRAAWDVLSRGVTQRISILRAALFAGGSGHHGEVGGDFMGSFIADVRYAVRTLVRRPVFTLTAVVTLALGIGANTAVFTIVNGLLLRQLPYESPDELVLIWSQNPARGWTRTDVVVSDAWDFRNRTSVFDDVAVYDRRSVNLTGVDRPERLAGHGVTPNVFSILGIAPAQGRSFTDADNLSDAPPVAILSHGFWQRRFGADPEIVGATVALNGEVTTVIGVMPQDFSFLQSRPDVWMPFREDPATARRGDHSNIAIGRLLPGVTLEQARIEVAQVAQALEEEYPESNRGWGATVNSMQRDMVGDVGVNAAIVLTGAVGFVLLMACVNVANLLLARANGRRVEMAIRSALGAGRRRVIRQLVTESLLLGIAGGAVGVYIAAWGSRFIVNALPSDVPAVFEFGLDTNVLAFALFVSLAATLLFGLSPALRASGHTGGDLREGGRAGRGSRARRFGGFLVVTQTALAAVLLIGGVIMARSVIGMARQDPGYAVDEIMSFRLTPPEADYPDRASVAALHDDLLERLRALPGVSGVGSVHVLPLGGSNTVGSYLLEGEDASDPDRRHPARFDYVSAGYFETMGVELIRGRTLGEEDTADSPPTVVVNETLAERHFGGDEPVGQRLLLDETEYEIVGVVGDHFERSLAEPVRPSVYLPSARFNVRSRSVVVRSTLPATQIIPLLQREVAAVDADVPIYEVRTMRDLVDSRVDGFALIAQLMVAFALVSLALGAVGIYGVTAYGVGQRTQEIGIRMALGAGAGEVRGLVVRDGLRRSVLGVVLGLALAFGVTRAMAGLLVGVSPTDPPTFAGVTLLLLAVAFLGSWLPALRASSVNPVRALGGE